MMKLGRDEFENFVVDVLKDSFPGREFILDTYGKDGKLRSFITMLNSETRKGAVLDITEYWEMYRSSTEPWGILREDVLAIVGIFRKEGVAA